MRSSKSRSRSKSNRPRSIGNIINRVFDSNGPEGKVRGTPQQIIEKYQILARDAQLSNDRVAAENFMQHAEHYTRLLAEAQRELAAEQEARQQQQGGQNGQNGQGGNRDRNWQDRNDNRSEPRFDPTSDDQPEIEPAPRMGGMMDFIEDLGESSLVETPETRTREPQHQQRSDRNENRDRQDRGPRNDQQGRNDRNDRRPPRQEQPRQEQPRQEHRSEQPRVEAAAPAPAPEPVAVEAVTGTPAAPSAEKAPAARKPRAPRKPKAESGPAEAAE